MYPIDESFKADVTAIVENEKAPVINEQYKKDVTAKLVENQLKFLKESANQTNVTGSAISNWDPVLINMVRRSAPKSLGFDIAGLQPMSQPTGLVFAIRSRYTNQTGAEANINEPNTAFSGTGTQAGDTSGFATDAFGGGDPATGTTAGEGMATANAEGLGTTGGSAWAEMAFSIESTQATAKSRALKATYSNELATDLKAVHGLDAKAELGAILSTEIVAEQDRELLRKVNISAELGAQAATVPGRYNIQADADGRWMAEKFQSLAFQIDLESNQIGINTRRARGNFIIASSNVVSALSISKVLVGGSELDSDVNGPLFAGTINGRIKVYVDPYATVDYVTTGYRGANAWDAGIYVCPYVPLEMYQAVGEDSFSPVLGFKTRRDIIANPFAANTASGAKAGKGLGQGENPYFRKMQITGITL